MANETNYPSVNIISEGSKLEGFLKSEHDIRIGGVLKGTLETESKVIITEQGFVSGDIVCQNADIAGKVSGDVFCSDQLWLLITEIGQLVQVPFIGANGVVAKSTLKFEVL